MFLNAISIFINKLQVKASKNKNAPANTTDPNLLFENYRALSSEFKWVPIGDQAERLSDIRTVHNDIIVAKLRPGQEIEAR
jgi:DNA-directed RNA polymerase I and III subunit RPAC1